MTFSVTLPCVMEGKRLRHPRNCSLLQAESAKPLGAADMARGGSWGGQGGRRSGIPAPGEVLGQDRAGGAQCSAQQQPRQAHYA